MLYRLLVTSGASAVGSTWLLDAKHPRETIAYIGKHRNIAMDNYKFE